MSDKFNQVLAINLTSIDGLERLPKYSTKALLQASDSKAALALTNVEHVEAILISIYEPLNHELLSKFSKLKYIGVFGTSTKKIDLSYCEVHHIHVAAVHDYCDHETAEWVIWQILNFFRDKACPESVYEQNLALVGVGAVGLCVARKAFGLGMTLSYNSRNINPNLASLGALMIDKRELFKNSRIISFHTPAHTSWLTRDLLELLPKNALLINSCFGKISQNQDLEFFLEQRTDVTLVMDSIAATSYPELKQRARIDSNSAYDTPNSAKRLINKFFANIEIFNEQKAK